MPFLVQKNSIPDSESLIRSISLGSCRGHLLSDEERVSLIKASTNIYANNYHVDRAIENIKMANKPFNKSVTIRGKRWKSISSYNQVTRDIDEGTGTPFSISDVAAPDFQDEYSTLLEDDYDVSTSIAALTPYDMGSSFSQQTFQHQINLATRQGHARAREELEALQKSSRNINVMTKRMDRAIEKANRLARRNNMGYTVNDIVPLVSREKQTNISDSFKERAYLPRDSDEFAVDAIYMDGTIWNQNRENYWKENDSNVVPTSSLDENDVVSSKVQELTMSRQIDLGTLRGLALTKEECETLRRAQNAASVRDCEMRHRIDIGSRRGLALADEEQETLRKSSTNIYASNYFVHRAISDVNRSAVPTTFDLVEQRMPHFVTNVIVDDDALDDTCIEYPNYESIHDQLNKNFSACPVATIV
jgi:hypothetical protein